ncbi:DNA-binding response regulator [Methylophaga thalassica]|uniref:DNA-binding response regulator n=1 Tax=Methylophaga thalassica TaxID=40223 RepID=A0ABQ5TTW5_9GAMM|nr:DNA-binding response regulator [Methylophaga thalassica]GLP98989.1 DNA-binding response regulator [Methylophaga thalassica]
MTEANQNAVVLVVDDAPETLALLHASLVESGYTVLVANNGKDAIRICNEAYPDIVLLDAVMPELGGFDVCRRLKQEINTRHIPVIFMTGLTESEDVVAGFSAGGIDYVTKPLSPIEVIARLNTHLKNSRMMSHTQGALDAFGQAAIAVLPGTDKIIWQTPLARDLVEKYLNDEEDGGTHAGQLQQWIQQLSEGGKKRLRPLMINHPTGRLIFTPADIRNDEQWLILLREESEAAQVEALKAVFNLTKREAEVLHWVILGKTDKSIGEILGTSPRTVNKHMEHVFVKLGVETRTAAASLAVTKLHTLSGHANDT